MKQLITLFLALISFTSVAQTYNMSTTNITTCSGNFYDPGGSGGNYSNSTDYTMTICPSTPGSKISFNFTSFALEQSYDFLYIYDGNSTAATSLGAYSGSVTPVGIVQATGGNASGCLTFVFHSDISNTLAGWAASISCVMPCETINSTFSSSTPAPGAGSIIRVCQGQSVTFNGGGTFSSGSSAGATYTWTSDNVAFGTGTSATTSFPTPGVYVVNLNITKAGCINHNFINQIVQVSTTPSFAGTTTSTTSICLGQTATLIGSVTPTPYSPVCAPPVSGVTFLPDGTGASYNTCITVDCYNSAQTITSAADIANICMNIEHSYQGDLSIQILCPNGQVCNLKDYPGGPYNYLGAPLDDPLVGPGVGANYCFAMSGTVLLCNGPTTAGQGTPPYTSISAGTYSPTGNFSSLIGCPLNGNWCIKVTDNLGADNGYIFNWDVNFNVPPPSSQSFTPTIVSETWSGTNIISTSGNNSTIQPTTTGTKCYTLTAVDNFGCSYVSSSQCITVNPGPYAGVGNTLGVCSSAASSNLYSLLGGGVATTGTWSGPAPALTGGYLGTINPASYTAGTYNYTYTVPASGGCPAATAVVTVTIRPNPAATLSFTNPSCGATNGTIYINNTSCCAQTISSFASSLGSISGQTVTGLGAVTPMITLTNNFGCTFTVSTTLTSSPGPSNITLTPTNASCGQNNGSFTFASPVGGTAPYTYALNAGPFTAVSPITGLAAGTYSLTVKDANGCTYLKTVVIGSSSGPSAIAGTTTLAGCSLNNGTYNVTSVTGGLAAYTFSVDAVSTGSLTGGLAAGTHTITVKDATGCLFSTTFVISTATGPSLINVSTTNASCGTANGTSTVTSVTGGLAPYQYSFDNGAFSVGTTASGLTAGSHTVTVKDANTCTLTTVYTVLNNGSPTASITGTTNVTCNGLSNGSFTVVGSAGSGAPYSYTLTSPYNTNGTGQFSGLPAGVYNVTVRDVGGCTATASVTIIQPSVVTLTATSIPANCFGTATGTVDITGAGGVGPYQYNLNGGTYQASGVYPTQGAAIYNVSVKDANGCITSGTVQVTQPAVLNVVVATQNANCTASNGIATTTVSGGTPLYTYVWTGMGGAGSTSNPLPSGNYSVTVTDSKNCTVVKPAVIGVIPGGTATITALANVTCNGAANGSMTAGMIGGASPFTYSWSPGVQTTATAINLASNNYTCTITDFYGCKATAIGTITQPSVLTPIMNSNNVKCYGTSTGTVSAIGSGGTAPYSYLWSTLASTLATVNNVAIGIYPCNITDANNCTITQTIAVTQPSSITLTSSVTAANCNQANGSATITAAGGSPAYSYTWSTGSNLATVSAVAAGTYTINVKDANNCLQTLSATIPNLSGPTATVPTKTNVSCFGGNNGLATVAGSGGTTPYIYTWSNGQVTPTATNLLSGVYTVSVTDNAGCVASASVNITQPTALTLTISPSNPKCFGSVNGYGIAAALGGTPSYSYAWTAGGGTNATSNLLGAGNYGLSVTDGNGCVITATMGLVNPPAMSASITSTNVSCFNACNGTAAATSTNGVGAVSYYWTGGASPISAQVANGLCAGTYTMVATDQNNCTGSSIVTITQPAVLTASITSSGSITCNGGNNGFASVTPAGGTAGYTYAWSPSGGSAANANSLIAGNYVVTVTDTKACSATASVTILEPTPLATTLTTTNVKCNGGSDGTANVTFAGGAGTTSFLWQPGLQSGNFVNNLSAGGQTVTITSNGACPTILTFTLTQPTALTAVISSTNSHCTQADGSTNAVVSGGTSPLAYLWSNGISTLSNNNIVAGAYTFTVTDANNCKLSASGLINDIAGPSVVVTSTTAVKCFGQSNGAANTTISAGTPPYNISWTGNSATTQNVTNFNAGIHNITVTDDAGCIGTAGVTITQPTALVSAIGSYSNVTCAGFTNGQATMLVNGGTTNYSYMWTPSAQTSSVMISVGMGTYTCNVTDANLCTTSQVVTISQPFALAMISSSVSNISCFGGSNGQIVTNVTGGTPGLTYSWTPAQTNSGIIGSLSQGAYNLVITDMNNCSINASFNVTEPSALTSTSLSLPAKCGIANGSATVTSGGGMPGYNYSWNTAPAQATSIATNMAPGNWICTVIDNKGCVLTQSVNVANAPSPVITGFNVTQPLCFGQLNGSITINYTSGTPNYTVAWSSPISQVQTTSTLSQTVSGIGTGAYSATVTDSYGCSTSNAVNVGTPNPLILNTSATQTICFGQTAQIYGSASGGNNASPYTYTWTPAIGVGGGPHTISPIVNSSYTVSVSDVNGCSPSPKVISVIVTPSLSISGFAVTKCHGEGVILTPSFTSPGNGGVPQYNYIWNTGATTSSLTVTANFPSTPNTYTVIVDDGCTISNANAVFTVNVNDLPTGTFAANTTTACAPSSITFSATTGSASDTYNWYVDLKDMIGITNPVSYNFLNADTFSIDLAITNTLTGCHSVITRPNYIVIFPQPVAEFYAVPPITSILDPTISFINTTKGAVSYIWNFGDPAAVGGGNNSTFENPTHTYGFSGTYNVSLLATSIHGCTDVVSHPVEITPDFALYIPNCFTPDANGKNDMFQPLGVGIDEDNYRMDIFDRWGENIFTSNNFRKGWDGTVKGSTKTAPQGVYIYKLQVFDLQGGKHPYVGHVTVIRENQ
jgi:gliding motility-associated-like protein